MALTQRQYDQLNEIGISLWQNRSASTTESDTAATIKLTNEDFLQLLDSQLFQDILLALSITPDQISLLAGHLDLGLLNWHMADVESCEMTASQLTTPTLDKLSKSPQLKQQLWQLISTTPS